jgi:hypothetical protein
MYLRSLVKGTSKSDSIPKRRRYATHYSHRTHRTSRLSVEPVLGSVRHRDRSIDAFACLGCHTTGSIEPVHLLILARSSRKFQPCHASELVGALRRSSRRIRGGVLRRLDESIVVKLGFEEEERSSVLGELVVSRQHLLGDFGSGDCIIERHGGDVCEDRGSTDSSASGVEERGDGADCYGLLGCGGRATCVVLDTAADGYVAETVACSWEGERCGCCEQG